MFGLPLLCITESGPASRNDFAEECAKIGVREEHSTVYNPSSQSADEMGIGNMKCLLRI